MKRKYKWIRFEEEVGRGENPNYSVLTGNWICINKAGEELGLVEYKNGWRQFVFSVSNSFAGIDFNFGCLEDIADFLKQLNKTKGCYKVKPKEREC